jgi:PAS domain S-box-containing protein
VSRRGVGDGEPTDLAIAELVAGAAVIYHQALANFDFPALILELPRRKIVATNQAAADFFETPLPEMMGRDSSAFAGFSDQSSAAIKDALTSIYKGTIDAYFARRVLIAHDGSPKDFYVWCRRLEVDNALLAVVLVQPQVSTVKAGTELARMVLTLAPLVVGAAADWTVQRISCDAEAVFGWAPEQLIGRPILADVHPDDVGDLVRLTESALVGDVVCRHLRLRHRTGDWVPVRYLTIRLTASRPPEIAFALLPVSPAPEPSSGSRIADLENSLRRIVAELRAAGVVQDMDRMPSPNAYPELNHLTARQWQILMRLFRGERVTTIARELYLSPSTVRNHLTTIFTQFGVHSQAELLAILRSR